jgi:hypothetical protein
MEVAFSVFVVDTVARVAISLNKVDRRAYDAAISGLKGEGLQGCGVSAGGRRWWRLPDVLSASR